MIQNYQNGRCTTSLQITRWCQFAWWMSPRSPPSIFTYALQNENPMPSSPPIDHSLPELTELGLLSSKEAEPLHAASLTTTFSILTHFQRHKSFSAIEGLSEQSQRHLTRLSTAFLNVSAGKFTSAHLFDNTVSNTSALIIQVAIDWSNITG